MMIDIEVIKLLGSLCAIGWVLFRSTVLIVKFIMDFARKHQRADWQAEFLDRNYEDYKDLWEKYHNLESKYNKLYLAVAKIQGRVK